MVNVRGVYPSYIRLLLVLIFVPFFYSFSLWVSGSELFSLMLVAAVAVAGLWLMFAGMIPTKFDRSIASRFNALYDSSEASKVTAHTVSSRWVHGMSTTTLEVVMPTGKFKLTDTRNPFNPTRSGYSRLETSTILIWLSFIPESTEGYRHVKHMEEMLALKNLDN